MDKLTTLFKDYHAKKFLEHGATPRGVDWNDEKEMLFRYDKMLNVLRKDFLAPLDSPSMLDVGCGWGGLLGHARGKGIALRYTGIDVVGEMIDYCRAHHAGADFIHGDVFEHKPAAPYDFVVCNAILTQRLTASITEMDAFARRLARAMFDLCRHGIAFNMMSNRVNFTVENLFYKSPVEAFAHCIEQLSPRVILDHGYSSLASGKGKYYDFTVYVFKD
jgi:2-polyprenyl-3-methyl-5-hydroxy-6-metoxy-1,4-benzoquinol methylase